jgi:hypothetical protein
MIEGRGARAGFYGPHLIHSFIADKNKCIFLSAYKLLWLK